jgi:hypothetical protein
MFAEQQPYKAAPLFDEGVQIISYCPLCESSYNPQQARVLGETEESHLLHIECGSCSNSLIALVLISSVGVSSVGLLTDLAYEEVHRFAALPSITTDNVIDIHEVLNDEASFFAALVM